ncbi:MAG: hypothetical protein ACPGSM_22545 [Thiolinea sp.]
MNLDEVMQWRVFESRSGEVFDLSFLDAKKVTYIHSLEGKPDVQYEFWITYSSHCFTKDYGHQTDIEREVLNYHAPKESRPFCQRRYYLAQQYLCHIVENLGSPDYIITDAGYGSYLTAKVVNEDGEDVWYHVPFKVYRQQKKYRLHVMSAFPAEKRRGAGKIGFFKIAYNLRMGKKLPSNPHRGRRR